MPKLDLLSRLEKVDEVFSLPQTLLEVLQAVEGDDWSAKAIASVISKDPGLTAHILRMANSTYYRQSAEISTVNRAVVVLGASMVKCLALSIAIFTPPKQSKEKFTFDIQGLYTHFLSTAISAKYLAEMTGATKSEEAFTAGLLHDIGMIFILKAAPKEYLEILDKHDSGLPLVEMEREAFDTDHAEIGYLISRRWQLPSTLQNAIGNHHRIINYKQYDNYDGLDRIVALANLLNRHFFSASGKILEQSIQDINALAQSLEVTQEMLSEVNEKIFQETFQAAEHLGIECGDPIKLLEKANKQLMQTYVTIENLFRQRQDLSRRIIEEERKLGAMKSKNIAVATLSHYLNNAATVISGRIQLIARLMQEGMVSDTQNKLGPALDVIDSSLTKILAVLEELKSLTDLEDANFYVHSSAINIDDNIERRMKTMKQRQMS